MNIKNLIESEKIEFAERRAKEEAKRRMRLAKEKEAREAKERATREEAARKRAEEQEELSKKQQFSADSSKNRHMACNIPFAYVVPHCWRLAKTNPIFGLKNENDLIFLQ